MAKVQIKSEKLTSTEVRYNKLYSVLGKTVDKDFEDWRKEYK